MTARHVIIDVEAVLDPSVPVKEGSNNEDFQPPVRWQIVAIGCFAFVDYTPEMFGCIRGATEREKIAAYADYLEKDHPCVVTWNGRGFDNPLIGFRALRYALQMPWWYGSARGPRYRYGDKSIDVKDWLADYGATQTASQSQVARLIGWPGKGAISGGDVAELYARGEHATIDRYCLGDVAQLSAVWLRTELLRGNLSKREWPKLARRLLAYLGQQEAVKDVVAEVDAAIFVDGGAKVQLALGTD